MVDSGEVSTSIVSTSVVVFRKREMNWKKLDIGNFNSDLLNYCLWKRKIDRYVFTAVVFTATLIWKIKMILKYSF